MSSTTHARTVWVSSRTLSADRAGASSRRAALAVTVAAALGLAGAVRGAVRLEVEGASMAPTLRAGDRVVALRWPRPLPVPPGAVVAVRDPRDGFRVMVKRVAGRTPDGVVVAGDNAARSTDSRAFGPVPRRLVVGVVLYRYHPEGHTGWVARRRGDAGTAVSAARQ